MEINFGPRDYLQINDARIVYRNFAGQGDKFNRPGDRNFALVIDSEEDYDKLINHVNEFGAAWNIKVKPPRNEDEEPFRTMKVKISFTERGPNVYLVANGVKRLLDQESVACLDRIAIDHVDLDIRPYDGMMQDRPFRAAYLHSMCVYQAITDRFADDNY